MLKPAPHARETGWSPDFVFTGGAFEPGLAFFADELGRITRFSREPADLAAARRLEGQAALPGLVNTHAQCLRRLDRGRPDRAAPERLTPEDVHDTARMAFLEMLLSGVTCVGECGTPAGLDEAAQLAILRAARDLGIRAWLFVAADDDAGLRRRMDALRARLAAEPIGEASSLGVIVPDFGTIPPEELAAIAAVAHAGRHRLQIASPAGRESAARFLATHGLLDKRVAVLEGAPIAAGEARALGEARAQFCAGAGVDAAGAETLANLRAAGVEVALGTHAHPRFDLLDAARRLPGGGTPAARFHAATVAGARALGAPSGALEVGRPADFFTVNRYDPAIAGASPEGLLEAVLEAAERRTIREVWVGGRPVVTGGRHARQGAIVARFVELQGRR